MASAMRAGAESRIPEALASATASCHSAWAVWSDTPALRASHGKDFGFCNRFMLFQGRSLISYGDAVTQGLSGLQALSIPTRHRRAR